MADLKSKTIDLTGSKIGEWSIIDFGGYVKHNAYWICDCSCGFRKNVKAQYLLGGVSRSCIRCANKAKQWTTAITPAKWHVIKSNAQKRGIAVSVTSEEMYALFEKQNKTCALSGLYISLPLTNADKGTASLDRIDGDAGYVLGNVQWVHKEINMMKGTLNEDRFKELCHAVIENIANHL